MLRLTPELAKTTMEAFGFRLEQGTYGLFRSEPVCRYGCAQTLLILAATQDITRSVDLAHCWTSTISEAIGVNKDYIEGLESGFEGFENEIEDDDEMYQLGVKDGRELRPLTEDKV